jgi:zinc protease
MRYLRIVAAAIAVALAVFVCPGSSAAAGVDVTRATLSNGLQIIVVHNPLAPVVTTMLNYRSGSDDQTVDGLAHATEHMMFRGSKTVSSAQLMDTLSLTGGDFDADTQDAVTQYFFTLPSQYLDVALKLERSRAAGLLMSQSLWNQERGAITQEVTQDNSNAIYRLYEKMSDRLVAGTPYAKNGLGTVSGFAHDVNSKNLLNFYSTWYHPNNATYVIVGDVDGPSTIAKVKALFGDLPAAKLPVRPPVKLKPVTAATYHDTSDQPFTVVLLGYRMPGYDSPDYAAGQILADVLNNSRSTFGSMPFEGKALFAQFQVQAYQHAGVGIVFGGIPVTSKPEALDKAMRDDFAAYAKSGVPDDLVAASKLREISQLEFNGNSIEGLAFQWSQAVAVQGVASPDSMKAQFAKVTTADVNRVLRTYLDNANVIAAYAVPKNSGAYSSGSGMAKEDNGIPPSHHEPLPAFAQAILSHLAVPPSSLSPTDTTLPNGLRLIVQPEHITGTVVVSGEILNNPQVQEPAGQEGVADIASQLLPFGTTTYDRVAFQTELDKIAATTSAGTQFGVEALSGDFDRSMQLLADEELHPSFDPKAFAIVQKQSVGSLTGEVTSPDHLTDVALNKALYPAGDPLQRFASPQSAGALTLDQVKGWYAAAYRPDLTTIVVTGDVTPEQAQAVVAKYFGGWAATGPKPNVYPPSAPANAAAQITVPANGRVQSSVQLVETTDLLRSDPAWAPLQVANTVLTGGFYSSLLYHDLREVHGYAYSVDSRFVTGKVRSSFHIDYACDPQNIVPAQSQVAAILTQLQTKPAETDRLLRAKALLMGDVPIRAASYDGVSALLLNYATRDLPLNQGTLDAQAELAATKDDVQAALAKYVRPSSFVRIVTGPGPK